MWCEVHEEWFIKKDLMVPMGIEQCNQQLKEIHLYTFFLCSSVSLIIVKVFNSLAFQTKPSKTNGKIWLSFLLLVFYLSIIFFLNINFVSLRKQLTFGDTTTDI